MTPSVLFDISAHGLGHLAQAAPVVMEVSRRLPQVPLIIRSGLKRTVLELRISTAFTHLSSDDDFGLEMTTSFAVDRSATARRYIGLHETFAEHIAKIGRLLDQSRVGLVVSNVGYSVLAAAQARGISNIAFSSINWHDVVAHYCGGHPGLEVCMSDMRSAYRNADIFLRLVPGTAMAGFHTVAVPQLIVARGAPRRDELRAKVGAGNEHLVAVFSFTEGEAQPPPLFDCDAAARIICVGPSRWSRGYPWVAFEDVGFSFLDLVASADLIVAKPGYGIVTEAAIAGTPTVLVPRDDWPETRTTGEWYRIHGRFETTSEPLDRLTSEGLREAYARLLALDAGEAVDTGGADRIAQTIADRYACGVAGM